MIEKQVAQALLDVKAVMLSPTEPYTWASGLKSPIYCDNRLTMSYPDVRNMIAKAFAQKIKELCPEVDYIVGTATAGIPQACWVANELNLPMAYVRPEPKAHGRSQQIEGFIPEGSKVVLIEDLISTGGSSIKAVQALNNANIEVMAVFAVFTYELEKALINFKQSGTALVCLSNYSTLIEVAKETNVINEAELALLESWRESPETFGV